MIRFFEIFFYLHEQKIGMRQADGMIGAIALTWIDVNEYEIKSMLNKMRQTEREREKEREI